MKESFPNAQSFRYPHFTCLDIIIHFLNRVCATGSDKLAIPAKVLLAREEEAVGSGVPGATEESGKPENASKEVDWNDDDLNYMHLTEFETRTEKRLKLPRLSELMTPTGEIRYMRKGQRCKAHIGDFIRYMKSPLRDQKWVESYLTFLQASNKGGIRFFWKCKNCGHKYPENPKALAFCPKCGQEAEIQREDPPKARS